MSDPSESVAGARVFVTGGTGFVGSHLVEELLRRNYGEVRCLVRSELKWIEGLDVAPVRGTLFARDLLREALRNVDFVYHVGGVTRARRWEIFHRNNVEATVALMDAIYDVAPAVRRVVVASSLAAVGRYEKPIADESAPLRPVSAYGRSKAEMERSITGESGKGKNWSRLLPISIVRPPVVYGPRERDVFTLFRTASHGIFPVLGSGRQPDISLVHVSDLVKGMIDAAETPGATHGLYFVGSDVQYAWRDVQRALNGAFGRRTLRLSVPQSLVVPLGTVIESVGRMAGVYPPFNREKALEARYACKMCSSERARAAFGYRQRMSLEDGARETLEWYRQAGWL